MKPEHVFFASLVNLFVAVGLVMGAASTAAASGFAEHTPGNRHLVDGDRAYRNGQYTRAKVRFLAGARWADKLAQFNLGVMNYHGQGVPQDKARAWAWFALSAERGYPRMVEMADQIYRELNDEKKARGQRILEDELQPQFGDNVAVERTARRMERERRRATGSRTGAIGSLVVIDRSGQSRTGQEFYRADAWDFRQIIDMETRIFNALDGGTVSLRDLEIVEEKADEPED